MEVERRYQPAPWRWTLVVALIVLNICLPSLILSYGVLLVHSVNHGVPFWLAITTPAIFLLVYSITQCWCREAADSWGGNVGYRLMASLGLFLIVISLLACAFAPYHWQPFIYGGLGGMGSSLISAQVDAVIFDTYDMRLGIIRGICHLGQALGQSIFPYILTALIDQYGYSLSYIVLSAIVLQTLPAIMFLKVDESIGRPISYSRYSDLAKTYAMFDNDLNSSYANELQLTEINQKSWRNPSDEENFLEDCENFEIGGHHNNIVTVTPPPSPEEKRRNMFGVEILPEIPEESEDEPEDDTTKKQRFSATIKRLSSIGDSFDDYISRQSEDGQAIYSDLKVTYDNIAPITDIERERIYNSFSFKYQSACASVKRRFRVPSYRTYRLRRRLQYMFYNLNDTFIKPLYRSLTCWRFYPALMLSFSRLCLMCVLLTLIPYMDSLLNSGASRYEKNLTMAFHGFTWACFLFTTPWLAKAKKRNYKYITLIGLKISTVACFIIAEADNHDMFSIGCVAAGLGFGAIMSCWESSVQDFVGVHKWSKIHSTLETLSGLSIGLFVAGLSYVIFEGAEIAFCVKILCLVLAVVTFVWFIIAVVSFFLTKRRSCRRTRCCL